MDETTPQHLDQRVAALEYLVETVLPMLIQNAPHHGEILRELEAIEAVPAPRMQGNEALTQLLGSLLDAVPEPDAQHE